MRFFLLPLVGALMSGVATVALAGAQTEPFFPQGKEQPLNLQGSALATPAGSADAAHAESAMAANAMDANAQAMMAPQMPMLTDPVSVATRDIGALIEEGLNQARVQRLPLAVMPFVERPHVQKHNALGGRISESFVYQLQSRGFNLVDYRAVSMNTTVKSALSAKQLSGLRSRFRIYFVLTGTYARYPDGIVINARVLDTTTRQVVASGQAHIANDQLEGALPGYDPLTAMRKGMIIENAQGPAGVK